ncbi:hypothetical protein ACIG0C_19650 [Kitasatospora aureofaciens]|nr:hypothetical protein [Kitasatospora aureofaciens]ARF82910.1 hypothetical protein B6264_18410 [Kitasatospora aureofaciens]OEV33607.1 hypothetical protein HS99_0013190 [Kitasatospora aureofaciens]QEV01863.1 hypothetical protein CP971_23835 [Streptomyces viridifaciens]UKZ08320.1 hypothetical protein BOQ63_030745 [Streptomyces viridifaciens]
MPLGFHRKPTGRPGEWFYCIKHGKVEEGPECPAKDRLGPYATPDEAAHALETADERNREWQNDPRWTDQPKDEGDE